MASASLAAATEDLRATTSKLGRLAQLVATFTIVNLIALAMAIIGSTAPGLESVVFQINPAVLAFISAILSSFVLLLILNHDRIRRHGEAVFEEISEELQITLRSSISKNEVPRRPALKVRLAMRQFTAASYLPLASRRNATASYFAINLLFTILATMAAYLYYL